MKIESPAHLYLSKKTFEELSNEVFEAMSIEDTAKMLCKVWTENGITNLQQLLNKELRRNKSVR